jgi:hypothetical protein
MLQDCRDSRRDAKSIGLSKRALRGKRKVNKRAPIFSRTDNGFVRKLQNSLAHTLTYFAIWGFGNS